MKHVVQSILLFALFSVLVCVHRWLGVFELERIEVKSFPGEQLLIIIAVVGVGLGALSAIGITGSAKRRWKTVSRVGATFVGLVLLIVAWSFYEHLRSKLDFPDPASMNLLTVQAVIAFSLCYFAFGLMMESFISLFLRHGGNHPDAG